MGHNNNLLYCILFFIRLGFNECWKVQVNIVHDAVIHEWTVSKIFKDSDTKETEYFCKYYAFKKYNLIKVGV